MKKIIMVEDELWQEQAIVGDLKDAFPQLDVVVFRTERDFQEGIEDLRTQDIAVFIFDSLIAWSNPRVGDESRGITAPGNPEDGGLRCARAVASDGGFAGVPLVLYTIYDAIDIADPMGALQDGIHYVQKGDSISPLILKLLNLRIG